MISSPCKDCPKRDEEKEDCLENCELIKGVQRIIIGQGEIVSASLDQSDTLRLKILVKPRETKSKIVNLLN